MSTFIPGQWDKRPRRLYKPPVAEHRIHCAADSDHVLVPYFRTPDTCPTCTRRYTVGSSNGVAHQSCACGTQPVPIRRNVPVDRNTLTGSLLDSIHRSVLRVPDIERPCLVCRRLFVQTHGLQETCSSACAAARRKLTAISKPVQEKRCLECQGKIKGRRLTCSRECLVTRRRRIQREVYRAHLLAKEIL